MKDRLFLPLLLACTGLALGPARGQAQTQAAPGAAPAMTAMARALPANSLAQALTLAQQAAERASPAGARVAASLGSLDRRLNPAPCGQAEVFLPRGATPWGRTRVGLRCVEGPVRWTLYLPVQVQVQAPAPTLRTALPAGSVLAAGDLAVQWVDWSAQPQPPITDTASLVGRTLARAATPGQPLRQGDLQARRWFAAGDRVKVLAGGAGFAIAAEGQALTEGRDGQRVRVQMLLLAADGRSRPGPIVQGEAVGEHLVALLQ